jgi:hypothetical protein
MVARHQMLDEPDSITVLGRMMPAMDECLDV